MLSPETHRLVFTAAATGEVLDLSEEAEDLLIAIILKLVQDEAVLSAEFVGDILDAEVVG